MADNGTGALLMNGVCPYNYQCKAMDCMECLKKLHGEQEKKSNEREN